MPGGVTAVKNCATAQVNEVMAACVDSGNKSRICASSKHWINLLSSLILWRHGQCPHPVVRFSSSFWAKPSPSGASTKLRESSLRKSWAQAKRRKVALPRACSLHPAPFGISETRQLLELPMKRLSVQACRGLFRRGRLTTAGSQKFSSHACFEIGLRVCDCLFVPGKQARKQLGLPCSRGVFGPLSAVAAL